MKVNISQKTEYWKYIQPGDEFDVTSLVAKEKPELHIHLFKDPPLVDFWPYIYPKLKQINGSGEDVVDKEINKKAEKGAKPISEIIIVGHHHIMGELFGDTGASFDPSKFRSDKYTKPEYSKLYGGQYPRYCWFRRDATGRGVGCASYMWGWQFSQIYLRKGASINSTLHWIGLGCPELWQKTKGKHDSCTLFTFLAFKVAKKGIELSKRFHVRVTKTSIFPIWVRNQTAITEFNEASGHWYKFSGSL